MQPQDAPLRTARTTSSLLYHRPSRAHSPRSEWHGMNSNDTASCPGLTLPVAFAGGGASSPDDGPALACTRRRHRSLQPRDIPARSVGSADSKCHSVCCRRDWPSADPAQRAREVNQPADLSRRETPDGPLRVGSCRRHRSAARYATCLESARCYPHRYRRTRSRMRAVLCGVPQGYGHSRCNGRFARFARFARSVRGVARWPGCRHAQPVRREQMASYHAGRSFPALLRQPLACHRTLALRWWRTYQESPLLEVSWAALAALVAARL